MKQPNNHRLHQITEDLETYFNWSVAALVPVSPNAADTMLKDNKPVITKVAQKLLKQINYKPHQLYRGIILRKPVLSIEQIEHIQYISFSEKRETAMHFANIKGFGSEIMDIEKALGKYGYIIEYTPLIDEIVFHHEFLQLLPYADFFSSIGLGGIKEVDGLSRQYETMILPPKNPFTKITPIFPTP